MSLSIADYSARIRDSLVDAKDSVLRIPPTLSETSLTTRETQSSYWQNIEADDA